MVSFRVNLYYKRNENYSISKLLACDFFLHQYYIIFSTPNFNS